jgi:hypothetical protein
MEDVWFPRTLEDGAPLKLDASPVSDGKWQVAAWDALLPQTGFRTTYMQPFDPEEDDGEPRYRNHVCNGAIE